VLTCGDFGDELPRFLDDAGSEAFGLPENGRLELLLNGVDILKQITDKKQKQKNS
jgi:hypothetical protein